MKLSQPTDNWAAFSQSRVQPVAHTQPRRERGFRTQRKTERTGFGDIFGGIVPGTPSHTPTAPRLRPEWLAQNSPHTPPRPGNRGNKKVKFPNEPRNPFVLEGRNSGPNSRELRGERRPKTRQCQTNLDFPLFLGLKAALPPFFRLNPEPKSDL